MNSDINGTSQCQAGHEKYEVFTMRRKQLVQYDYRTVDGILFSCIHGTLEECREHRDTWLTRRTQEAAYQAERDEMTKQDRLFMAEKYGVEEL